MLRPHRCGDFVAAFFATAPREKAGAACCAPTGGFSKQIATNCRIYAVGALLPFARARCALAGARCPLARGGCLFAKGGRPLAWGPCPFAWGGRPLAKGPLALARSRNSIAEGRRPHARGERPEHWADRENSFQPLVAAGSLKFDAAFQLFRWGACCHPGPRSVGILRAGAPGTGYNRGHG